MKEEDLDPALLIKGNAALAKMEQQLAQTPYLVGDAFSLADVALVAYTRKAALGGFDLAQYPAVMAWISRVERDLRLPSAAA
jgi:glutathione S-transferase